LGLVGLAAALVVGLCSCSPVAQTSRYDRKQAQAALARFEAPGLVIGEFKLAPKAVLDGDTIKVSGIDTSLRLLAIDSEETFKDDADRRAANRDFEAYLASKRTGDRPAKAATPLGEAAKDWAKDFFAGVKTVRLERDHPKEVRGRFNRYLTYVFAQKDGVWVNYNIECVRAGMSPYFSKYGYSRRFHDEFVAAEREARAAQRGVWDPNKQHYRDYDERKKWWDARANFIQDFERAAVDRDDFIVLTNWDALKRLERSKDREVTLLAAVGQITLGDRGPTRVMLSRRQFADFALVFFDKDVFGSSGIADYAGEFVRVRGRVSTYNNKRRGRTELQMVINRPGQIIGSSVIKFLPESERALGSQASSSTKAE
ncbi:MAG: thermonuclease family protein, partial [Myxococcota bacterium]